MALSYLLILMTTWTPGVSARTGPQNTEERIRALKSQAVEIPAGAVVEVKLEGRKAVRGKLGAVTDAGITVTALKNGSTIGDQQLSFDQIRSIQVKGKESHAWSYAAWAIIGAGALFLGLVALAMRNN